MIKLSLAELDHLLLHKGAEEVPANGRKMQVNPMQTGEQSSKEPALRKPIDKAIETATNVGTGLAGAAAALTKVKANLPLKEIPE